MITQFEINTHDTPLYSHRKPINDTLIIHYQNEEVFYEVKSEDKHILLYGYAFDVREPEVDVQKTLKNLSTSDSFRDDLHHLNGQYFLVYKESGTYYFSSDAVCITPIFMDKEHHKLTCENVEVLDKFSSQMRLNLSSFEYERIPEPHNKLTNERLERIILDLVKDQYKYFEDKTVALNFRANSMNKGLIALLSPILKDNELYVRDDTELNNKVANIIAKEFHMNLVENNKSVSSEYLTNTHLMDFMKFLNDDVTLDEDEINAFRDLYLLQDHSRRSLIVEYHLLNQLRYHQDAKKNQFVYDPFNVRMIQNRIYKHDQNESFNPVLRIIKILKPMITYYDFATGRTLQQRYTALLKENEALKSEVKNSVKNYEFIQELKGKGIDISPNLDGTYNENGLVLQPAHMNISKDEVFTITYRKSQPGMMIVETFFDNPRNAHRIQMSVNHEAGDVSTFLGGKFINVEEKIEVTMQYERDYNAASWQKAGKIRIAEID